MREGSTFQKKGAKSTKAREHGGPESRELREVGLVGVLGKRDTRRQN